MRSKQLVSVLLWLCLAALVVSSADFTSTPVDADQLEKELSELNADLIARHHSTLKKLNEAQEQAGAAPKNGFVCTNGVDPAKLSVKDYINAFAAGPCTPVVFLGGITATKMQVLIDCETLQSQSLQVFNDCKWTTCKNSIFNTGKPKAEYTIWIPDLLSPMSVINPTAANKRCFVGLFGLHWYRDAQGKLQPQQTAGVTVKPMGFSPATRTSSRCGFDAISGILPSLVQKEDQKGFNKFRIHLESMGYKIGLTIQAEPYDWRRPYYDNEVHHEFNALIEEMYKVTGKRISVVAHSFGNINMANALSQLSSENRNKWIQRYFALAPPYLGSPATWSMVMGAQGDAKDLDFFILSNSLATFPSVYDLMPRASWSLYENANWLKSIKNRIAVEEGKAAPFNIPASDDITNKVLPSISDNCYDKQWKDRKTLKCTSGMSDFGDFGRILTDPITDVNIGHSLNDYSHYQYAKLLFDGADKRADYDRLDNPEVQTVIIYSNMLNTDHKFYWDYNPRSKTEGANPDFAHPTYVHKSLGDSIVVTSSTLIAGLKWAFEHDKQQTPNSKAIVFAELCSVKNPKSSVYQSPFTVTDNEYQGIPCSCTIDNTEPCDHSKLIQEPNLINYVANSLLDGQKANPDRKFNNWTEEQAKNFVNNCDLLYLSDRVSGVINKPYN
jgi:hypothetical protein